MNKRYEHYIHSSAWREKADERLELDHHICCVCGKPATEVHHLTYDHFGEERPEDLVSLCRRCHEEAEEIYDPSITPWAMGLGETEHNFMAVMRTDARQIAPIVADYLMKARGGDFDGLMQLRQPDDPDKKRYWGVLKKAVRALCRKRYSMRLAEDRMDMVLEADTNRVTEVCLAEAEHWIRNSVQGTLHDIVLDEYDRLGKWKSVGEAFHVSPATVRRLKTDAGISAGPSLREEVLYFCALDAAAGNRPIDCFRCLEEKDYECLNAVADYFAGVYGEKEKEGSENGSVLGSQAKSAS